MDTIIAIDFIEFYVGNALLTSNYYQIVFGFKLIGYKNSETGSQVETSYVVRQGNITLVFTSSNLPNSPIHKHVSKHGDGVKRIAFEVCDVERTSQFIALKNTSILKDRITIEDEFGKIKSLEIEVYGDTTHLFLERKYYSGCFLPHYSTTDNFLELPNIGLTEIDHFTANVEYGKIEKWTNFYIENLGFIPMLSFDGDDIYAEYSAMMSKVVVSKSGIRCPISQPINKLKKSQIQEFLDYNKGAGVQHIAICTNDIIFTVSELMKKGVPFLPIPSTYYSQLSERVDIAGIDINLAQQTNVMVDNDADGILLQAFTKPLLDRPTFFIEFIQRNGATTFGKNNVKALYNALVAEQQKRAK